MDSKEKTLIDDEINILIKKEMNNNEILLWSGKPVKRLVGKYDRKLFPYSLYVMFLALVWEVGVIITKAPIFMPILGIYFVCIAMYVFVGRFFYKSYLKKRTYYCITNKRVIIIKSLKENKIISKRIEDISIINKEIEKEEIGNIIFGNRISDGECCENTGMELLLCYFRSKIPDEPLIFYDLDRVSDVFKLINEVKYGNKYKDVLK